MSLTLGFIILVLSIIIPGLLFQRFFYYGEFSKQFNTKSPVLNSIFYSIVPGIFVQMGTLLLFKYVTSWNLKHSDILSIYFDLMSENGALNQKTIEFLDNDLLELVVYSAVTYLLALASGFLLSRLIRKLKLDRKYKIFRYKNQWYYVFSGEISSMKKFQESEISLKIGSNTVSEKSSITYADILVSNSEGQILYTGYLADYDLNSNDISKLDKIYLLDAYRYKNVIQNSFIKKDKKTKTIKKKIAGDVFVLSAENIININLTFFPSLEKEKIETVKKQILLRDIQNCYLGFIFLFAVLVGFQPLWLNENFYYNKIDLSLFQRLLLVLFVNQLFWLFLAWPNKKGVYIFFSKWRRKLFGLFLIGFFLWYFLIKDLL